MGNKKISIQLGFIWPTTLIFIILKLCHVIDWSWVWVLAPMWMTFIAFFIVALTVAIIAGLRLE